MLPFLLRVGLQEEIAQIHVASLCADEVTEAPHLLPGYFLLSRIWTLPASRTHQGKKEMKFKSAEADSKQAVLWHGTSVLWCYPYVFSFVSANVHTGKLNRQSCGPSALPIWDSNLIPAAVSSSCEFCSSDTGSAIVELAILINNEYPSEPCAEEMWTKQWCFWRWDGFRNPARNLSNWLVQES